THSLDGPMIRPHRLDLRQRPEIEPGPQRPTGRCGSDHFKPPAVDRSAERKVAAHDIDHVRQGAGEIERDVEAWILKAELAAALPVDKPPCIPALRLVAEPEMDDSRLPPECIRAHAAL